MIGEAAVREMTENIYYSVGLIISGIIIAYISNRRMFGRYKSINLLLFLCFAAGAIWSYGYYYTGENDTEKILETYITNEEKLSMKLYISAVDKTSTGERLLLCKKNGFLKKKTYLIMYLQDEDGFGGAFVEAGRSIYVKGTVSHIEGATNPGQFDMKYYYLGKGVNFQIKCLSLKKAEDGINYAALYLGRIRKKASEVIDSCYEPEDAGILKTMLLGDRSDMSDETTILFRRNGVAHILAISGLHIALLAGALELLLSKLYVKRRVSAVIVIVFMVLYGIMTGFSPATLRAVLMLSVSKTAYIFKRTPDLPTNMMEALLIMVFINPDCIFSTGMLMSYAAVLGVWTERIFYDSVYMREHFSKVPERIRPLIKKLVGSIIISVSIGLWMTPLLMITAYEVPVFSLIINLFVTGLLTSLISCGFAVALTGMIAGVGPASEVVIKPLVFISSSILELYRRVCHLMLKCPFSVIISGHIEVWQAVIMYTCVIAFLVVSYKLIQRRPVKSDDKNRRIKLTVGYILCCMLISVGMTMSGKLYNYMGRQVVFLDVGQGDGSLIRSSSRRNYIIDCGSSSRKSVGKYTLIPALKYYGMDHVDAVFVSHTDTDHVSGIIELLENKELYGIRVNKVLIAEGTDEDDNLKLIEKGLGIEPGLEVEQGLGVESGLEVEQGPGKEGWKSKQENPEEEGWKSKQGYPEEDAAESKYGDLVGVKKGDVIDGCFEVIYPEREVYMEKDKEQDADTESYADRNSMGGKDNTNYVNSDSNENSLVVLFRDKEIDKEKNKEEETINETKTVSKIESKTETDSNIEVLYTGDISSEIEAKFFDDLAGRQRSRLRILKCPHHGSKYSSSEEFLNAYSPDMTVISVGRNNYGHPTKEAMQRITQNGSTIYRTDKKGAIIIQY